MILWDFRCASGIYFELQKNIIPTILHNYYRHLPTGAVWSLYGIGVFCWTCSPFGTWKIPRWMPGDNSAGLFEGRQRISKAVRKQVLKDCCTGTMGMMSCWWLARWWEIGVTKEIADASLIVLKIFFGSAMAFVWRTSSSVCSAAIKTGILKQKIL